MYIYICMYIRIYTHLYIQDTNIHKCPTRSGPYNADDRSGVSVELCVAVKVTPPNSTNTEAEDTQPADEELEKETVVTNVCNCSYLAMFSLQVLRDAYCRRTKGTYSIHNYVVCPTDKD